MIKKIISVIKDSYFYLFDWLFNRKIRDLVTWFSCFILVGDRGSGKSCLMALIVHVYKKLGYRIFSNYPYKDCFMIPYITVHNKSGDKVLLDKDFLYHSDLSHSVVIIDEARTVWNARAYASWNELDEEFFNFIRKTDTIVVLATQRYDGLDLNIRCAADATIFVQKCNLFHSFSSVDISRSCQLKIADKNTQVVSRGFSSGATKVVWDVGEMPVKFCHFYRPFYYNDFDTNFVNSEKSEAKCIKWFDDDGAVSVPSDSLDDFVI